MGRESMYHQRAKHMKDFYSGTVTIQYVKYGSKLLSNLTTEKHIKQMFMCLYEGSLSDG